jgi:SAM-dependent methyltransferase
VELSTQRRHSTMSASRQRALNPGKPRPRTCVYYGRMDTRETTPSPERNKQPILDVIARVLPPRGLVLEIGSGTGQHVAHFAKALPALTFQPSEIDVQRHASIKAWVIAGGLPNVRPPLAFDVTTIPWPVATVDAVVCINVIHISPWEATLGLMAGAARILPAGGVLITYGPYMRGGAHTSQSNEAFDASLRARNPLWGVRDVDKLTAVAGEEGIVLEETVPMPANNFTLVWRKPRGG